MKNNRFTFFWKPNKTNGYLSNWYPCKFTVKFKRFTSAEQALMYHKAKLFKDDDVAIKILNTDDPKEQRRLGRLVSNFDPIVWDREKEEIMFNVLGCKFYQNEDLAKKLIRTEDTIIAEASPYDRIWGIGMSSDNKDAINPNKWEGENLLGNALMRVRDFVKIKHLLDENL